MTRTIQAVIFDWAGTTIDYGCFAPVNAFLVAFSSKDMTLTTDEVRQFMGLLKKDHVRALLQLQRVQQQWQARYERLPNEADVEEIYDVFNTELMQSLETYTNPIPGVLAIVEQLRAANIKIGSTTGYTKTMMDVVAPAAAQKGYRPDYIVCGDELKQGRPYPYMIFENMKELDVFPPDAIMKVGDTISDIQEGKNAGVWTVGVIKGSNELGLTLEEVQALEEEQLATHMEEVRARFIAAGADFVIDDIEQLQGVIDYLQGEEQMER